MRLVTYTFRGTTRLGAMLGDNEVVDLNRACAIHLAECGEPRPRAMADVRVPADMLAFLHGGDAALDAARSALAAATEYRRVDRERAIVSGLVFATGEPGFRLEAPVMRPGKVLAIGINYRDHAEETRTELPPYPIVFTKVSTCITGPGAPIHRPKVSGALDWEGELCVVIGTRGRHVAAADAPNYVAGYMIGNDVSVRDWQFHSRTMMMGKGFDTHGVIGPWLATRDEVANPEALDLKTWVNGVLKQNSNTRNLVFGVGALVEYISTAFTLEPGDIIFTGTPGGVGVARNPPEFMKAGDVVRIEITGLGQLENPIIDEPIE